MKNSKFSRFWNYYYIQLILSVIVTLLLISLTILFIEEIDLNNTILIYNIFGTLTLVAFITSYNSTKKAMKTQLELGITRKQIYRNHIISTGIAAVVSIALVLYYMYIYIKAINSSITLFAKHFNVSGMVFLPLAFLFSAASGFALGIFRIKPKIFYPLFIVAASGMIYIAIKHSYNYIINIVVASLILILSIMNYLLICNFQIKE